VHVLAVLLCIITVRLTPIVLPVLAPEGYVAPPTLLVKTIVQFFLCSLLAILCSSHILCSLTSVRDIKIEARAFHCVGLRRIFRTCTRFPSTFPPLGCFY
jgi:hypothetical protein